MAKLAPEMQREVRRYIVKVISIPSIALSVIMFFVGFLINRIAYEAAYNEALNSFKDTNKEVLDESKNQKDEATKHATNAKSKSELAGQILKKIKSDEKNAEEILNQLRAINVNLIDENIVVGVANYLSENQKFIERIRGYFELRMTKVEEELKFANSSMEDLKANTRNITTSASGCDTIISLGNRRKAVFQCDGNLVIYRVSPSKPREREPIWDSDTRVRD